MIKVGDEMMRNANHALLGYKYQFLKTFLEILHSDEGSVIVCERFEDIDLDVANYELRIQCKYHGAAEKYTLGKIYKPLLEFMRSYALDEGDRKTQYRLFAHFPTENPRVVRISEDDCKTALGSTAKDLKKLIEIINEKSIDVKAVASQIMLEFGCDINELEKTVCQLLIDNGFSNDEIEQYVLSNGIYLIFETSCKENEDDRKTIKNDFLTKLRSTKAILMNKWVKELYSIEKYLKSMRTALKDGISRRLCNRTIIFANNLCSDKGELVKLIKDLRVKIHSDKAKHINNQMTLVLDVDSGTFTSIVKMLFEENLEIHTGYRIDEFNADDFLASPALDYNRIDVRGIPMRILQIENADILNKIKPDIYYFIGMSDRLVRFGNFETETTTCEELPALTYNQLRYVFSVRGDYT